MLGRTFCLGRLMLGSLIALIACRNAWGNFETGCENGLIP